ncbi:MAG: two-component system, cell cycle response regulator DivK [Blastocatellia bacterium]|jgi:two-component system response regulator|nr:two-component system, cell cycle response regulator DivK [Blastocatellia bacterium]MDX6306633.1 two-component system, cell cycle response regulator DivK [Blastocatellia bacterium]MDX6498462.1 two-component system, cell cycle response regulator DivK [Blastocatellia bacterium]
MKREKKLFLLVEDFEDSRFMMRRLLEMAGYAVIEASDGEQAVALAISEQPELILMDLSLPKLDGLAATRQIRQYKEAENTPIVAISAHDSPESRTEALAAGCNEYVTKPIDFDQLGEVLKHFLSPEPEGTRRPTG